MLKGLRDHQLTVTKKIIAIDGEQIVLNRLPEPIRTAEGGVKRPSRTKTALEAQTLAFLGVAQDQIRVIDDTGKRFELRWNLIGLPGANIEPEDTFEIGGGKFFVHEVITDQRWEVRAWVREAGPDALQG